MTRRQKAIKLFLNIEGIKYPYLIYCLKTKKPKNMINWFASSEIKHLSLKYYEHKLLYKLHPIIFKNSFLKNLDNKERENFIEKSFYMGFIK